MLECHYEKKHLSIINVLVIVPLSLGEKCVNYFTFKK